MTTTFLDNKICTFKLLLPWRFPRKTAFWTIFLSAAKAPTHLKKRKCYFYCRLAVSGMGRNFLTPWHPGLRVTKVQEIRTKEFVFLFSFFLP